MLVSVIICTYNRALLIKRLLDSLTRQTLSPDEFEVIVVVDGSTDQTLTVCQSAAEQMPNMQTILLENNSGYCAAANRGVKAAKGELVIFTDDDCIPESDWGAEMRKALQNHPIVAGGIESPTDPYLILAENISAFHPFMQQLTARQVDFIAGANMGFRREVLEQLGGFPEGYKITDMELILRARKLGYTIYFHPESRVLHDPIRGGLADLVRRTRSYSALTIQLRNEYRGLLHTPFYLRFRWWLLLLTPVISAGKTFQIFFGNIRMLRYVHTAPLVFLLKFNWCLGAFQGLRALEEKSR